MKKAITFVEILIVIAVIGIIASIILPMFQNHILEAKESTAKEALRVLRTTIELYAAQHNDVAPGYPDDDTSRMPHTVAFSMDIGSKQIIEVQEPGRYLNEIPRNPFNEFQSVRVLLNGTEFPERPTGVYAWIYQPETKVIKLDWPGTDSKGIAYYDY